MSVSNYTGFDPRSLSAKGQPFVRVAATPEENKRADTLDMLLTERQSNALSDVIDRAASRSTWIGCLQSSKQRFTALEVEILGFAFDGMHSTDESGALWAAWEDAIDGYYEQDLTAREFALMQYTDVVLECSIKM